MARLVVKNGLKMDTKVTHGTKRLDYICAHMVDFILGSMVNTNRRTYLNTCSKRESSLWLLITFAFKFWYGNLKWQSLWITIGNRMIKFNPKTKIVCKVGSALNMATDPNHYHSGASLCYLIISLSCKFNLVPSHHMTSFRNFVVFFKVHEIYSFDLQTCTCGCEHSSLLKVSLHTCQEPWSNKSKGSWKILQRVYGGKQNSNLMSIGPTRLV